MRYGLIHSRPRSKPSSRYRRRNGGGGARPQPAPLPKGEYDFRCAWWGEEKFEISSSVILENDFLVTDMQLESFKRDINGKNRPRNRFGSALYGLVCLHSALFFGSFISFLVLSVVNLVKYRSAEASAASSRSDPLPSSHLVDKSQVVAVVVEFAIGTFINAGFGFFVLMALLQMTQNYVNRDVVRRRKFLEHICAFHAHQTFNTSLAEVALSVSPEASNIHMKITPKPTDLL